MVLCSPESTKWSASHDMLRSEASMLQGREMSEELEECRATRAKGVSRPYVMPVLYLEL